MTLTGVTGSNEPGGPMPDIRPAGLRGRLPVKPPGERFNIQWLSSYLTTPLPAPVYPVDVSAGITDWGMLGNGPDKTCTTHPDGVGDCTFAGREHYRRAKAAAGHETEKWEDSNQLVAEYLRYDHGKDEGANIADLLLSWFRDKKILAFAPVDHTKPAAVDAAAQAFHGTYVGVNLTDDADTLFTRHEPWTVSGGQKPDPSDGHCYATGVRILTDDLRWIPIEELQVGDGIVGFDEGAGVGRGGRRKYRRGVVEASRVLTLPSCEVEFEDGSVITCSTDHRWLVKSGNLTHWARADELKAAESFVSRPFDTWETDESRDAGYVAAAFDGEGWLSRATGAVSACHAVGFSQRDNEMLEQVRSALKERGFIFSDVIHHKPQPEGFTRSEDIHTLSILGAGRIQKRPEILRFLGSIRPLRLLAKYSPDAMGSVYYDPWVKVVRVTPVGEHEVVALQTSSRTFVAEGFLSHNCIVKVGSDGHQLDTWVTWGALQQLTLAWTAACLDEAWVIITGEDAKAASLDIDALRRDIGALHGTGGS